MKSKHYFWSCIILLGCTLAIANCNNPSNRNQPIESPKTAEALEKEKVIKIAEEIAFKEYGDEIKNELPLKAQLFGDSMWIIQGTLPEGADGGTVYIELSKSDHRLLKITHYK
ncbi:NTF2 fold immunity protein [Deminuibacter soli]|uniref:NTF2 fold domain-containing protein n=1 Tax=Deminuibacter soli TaxID=2291815 RepID=A0A3E1NIR4_9BACT|nr:NTF2 fold immunity protein [Deminuibacter soli]RFM27668.1 hypothetical protein DXN05_13235 [Deminuibacter soli]